MLLLLKNLLSDCLQENKLDKLNRGKIKHKDVCKIIPYHQLIQNGGLLPFLIRLAAAIGAAANK